MITSRLLNVLVTSIIESYFQNSRCIFMFSENLINLEYKGIMPVVNINIRNNSINEELIFQNYGCQEIVIQHHNSSMVLSEIEAKMKLHKDRFNFRKYLIVPTPESSQNLEQIFNLPELEYIIDMLVIIPTTLGNFTTKCESEFKTACEKEEVFKLMTHKYVGRYDNNHPEVVDLWFSKNETYLNGNYLYPDKISNQQGRILKCASFDYKPYSIMDSSILVARGSENSAAHEYVKHLNMTIEYITDDDEWGIIYENWTGTGLLGNLATGKADIGYGALYTWEHEFAFLDFSKPTVRTGITCLVPAPRLAAGWLTPLFPFSLEMWIGTGISFLTFYFVTLILTIIISKDHLQRKRGQSSQKYKKMDRKDILKESFSSIVRIFLVQSVQFRHNVLTETLRYLFVIFLFSLLVTSIYSSGLATVMTIPRYTDTIETVLDLANSDIHWGATQDAWIFSLLAEERSQYVTIVKKFVATEPENLIEFAKTNNFAFSIERLPSGQYAIGNYITKDTVKNLRLMQEDLYWEYCIIMLRKNSPLLNSLDKFLLLVTEAGLIYFWEMQAAQTHMDLRVQNIVKYYAATNDQKQEDIVKLKLVHVEGAFGILVIGCSAASICFIIELLIYKVHNQNGRFAM